MIMFFFPALLITSGLIYWFPRPRMEPIPAMGFMINPIRIVDTPSYLNLNKSLAYPT